MAWTTGQILVATGASTAKSIGAPVRARLSAASGLQTVTDASALPTSIILCTLETVDSGQSCSFAINSRGTGSFVITLGSGLDSAPWLHYLVLNP